MHVGCAGRTLLQLFVDQMDTTIPLDVQLSIALVSHQLSWKMDHVRARCVCVCVCVHACVCVCVCVHVNTSLPFINNTHALPLTGRV